MPSPFDALIDDLMAVQATRTTQTPQRDTVSRAARQAAEAQRNRRMQQQQQRPLRKSEPLPDYAPDWSGLQARQQQIAADLEQTRIEQQKDAIRAHIATLMAAAKAGRLDPHSVCVLDVLRGRADSMGIAP